MAWLPGWNKRIKLTISQDDVDNALTDFPILVHLSTSSGKNSADVSAVFDELQSDANRKKIAIALPNSITECYVEIEKWDDANEEAWLWVKVSTVASGADTVLYLYYDADQADNDAFIGDTNSTPAENVWDANFKAVYHMADGIDSSHIYDSTGNNNDGAKLAANEPNEVDGQVGKAQDFDGVNDLIDGGAGASLDITTAITVENVLKPNWAGPISTDGYPAHKNMAWRIWDLYDSRVYRAGVYIDGGWRNSTSTTIPQAQQAHLLFTYNSASRTLLYYRDGLLIDTNELTGLGSYTIPVTTNHLQLGNFIGGKTTILDEVRISDMARTAAWIKATKESLWDDLLDFGSEELFDLASQVFIDDVGVLIRKGSLSINQRIEERSIAEFTVIDLAGAASYQRGQAVEIYNADGVLIFGGIIDTPEKVAISPSGGLYHPIRCIDWHYLADKRLVVAAWAVPTAAGVIVTALHASYLADEGITIPAGAVQEGPDIPEAIFNYVTVPEAFDILAEMAGYTWFINEHKQLFFIDRTTYLTPWNWSPAIPNPTGRLASLSSGNSSYRNRQYIRGGMSLTVEQTENRTGDGTTDLFIMSYPLAKEPEIRHDGGALLDVGIKGLETGKDYYWSKGDNVIYAEVAPLLAVAIEVKYYGEYPLISLALDEEARISRQAIEGGTGIVENIIYEAHDSGVSSQESARVKLVDYGRDAARFSYSTTDGGIRPGQLQVIDYPLLGLDEVEMLIESVTIRPYGNLVSYDVTAIIGPVIGSWTKFFSTMLRRQVAAIRIGDEKLLMLLRQAEDLALVEAPTSWQQLKGQYCWAVKTNGVGLREAYWDFFTWG